MQKNTKLVKSRFVITKELKKHIYGETRFVKQYNSLVESMIIFMETKVWCQKLKSANIKYPINWIESFKERWFTKYMLKKWPVKYKSHIIKFSAIYPNFVPCLSSEKYVIKVEEYVKTGESV